MIDVVQAVRHTRSDESGLKWDDVDILQYKHEGSHFRDITRQVLFDERSGLGNELRYFEIGPGGHSTLERHEHVHAVIILRGRGRVMIGESVKSIAPFDLVHIPPMTWHQFRAGDDVELGFLCLVPCDRDRPMRPTDEEATRLGSHPDVGPFVRL